MVTDAGRGQVFTLEAFVASLVVLLAVVFVLQTTGLTPLSASTSSQFGETQQRERLASTLDSARAQGLLRTVALSWDQSDGTFLADDGDGYATTCSGDTPFAALLERAFYDRELTCNVAVHHVEGDTVHTERLVYTGTPPDTAVSVARTVTLYDDDHLYNATGDPTDTTLAETSGFYATDEAPGGSLYNVVRVEVTVWRT